MPSLGAADFSGLTLQLPASQKPGVKDLELGPGNMEIRRLESKFSALQSKLLKLKVLISQSSFRTELTLLDEKLYSGHFHYIC